MIVLKNSKNLFREIRNKRKLNRLKRIMNCTLNMYGEYKRSGNIEDIDVIIQLYKESRKEYEDMKSKMNLV